MNLLVVLLVLVNRTPKKQLAAAIAATNSRKPEIDEFDQTLLLTATREQQADCTQCQQGDRAWFRNHRQAANQDVVAGIAD
jgi:hypothetical protein